MLIKLKVGQKVGESILSIEKALTCIGRNKEIELSEVMVDDIVNQEQKNDLIYLLNEYKTCIANDVSQIG